MSRSDLPIEAVSIDGAYIEDLIPGYKTITTTGREALTPEVESYTVGSSDGSTIKYIRHPER